MRTASKEIVLIKRKIQRNVGAILLPEEFTIGSSSSTSRYRIAEVVDGGGLAPGTQVVLGEMSSVEVEEFIGEGIHRAPLEFILAKIDPETGACLPLKNLVLVKPDPLEENISGSMLLMPDCSKKPSQVGTVIKVGPEVKDPELVEGARVIWSLFTGMEVSLDKEGDCILLRSEPLKNHIAELVAVIE